MKFGKRQLVLAALVVALGAAVYINWQFAGNNSLIATSTTSSTKELGQAAYVNNQVSSLSSEDASSSSSSSNSSLNETSNSSSSSSKASSSEGSSSKPAKQTATDANSQGSGEGTVSTAQDSNSTDYFSQATVSRQQSRDKALEVLKTIIDDEKATAESKTKATEETTAITKNIEQESNIENLVKAKGYQNCVAFIQNGECNIVVSSPQGLLESDIVIIKDIVSGQANISYDKIKIVQVK